MNEDTSALEARVASLEKQVAALRQAVHGEAPVVQHVRSARLPIPAATEPAPKPVFNAEAFFGGQLLLGVGMLAFLIGVGFFLKYAFDNGWIGPAGRVAIGLLAGTALLFAGDFFFRTGKRMYAEALSGLGGGILYLSLWAAGSYFQLVPLGATFIAMILVTGGIMAIALLRDAKRLAFVALAGGFLTPALNAGPAANLPELFTYIAVLNTALLWLTAKRWVFLEAAAFIATQLYLLLEMPWNTTVWTPAIGTTLMFATIFLLQFAAMPLLRARRLGTTAIHDIVIAVLAAGAYYTVLAVQLYDLNRHWLTAATVALAVVYLGAAYVSNARMRFTCAAISLAFITIGIGIAFTGTTLLAVWSIEGAVLLAIGVRTTSLLVRIFGYAAYLCALIAVQQGVPGGAPFMNPRFETLLVTALGLTAVVLVASRMPEPLVPERDLAAYTEAGAHLCVLVALGFEFTTIFGNSLLPVSLLMLLYAVILVGVGFATRRVFTRWEGLALFGALIAKVFVLDMASVDPVVRMVSFLAVGFVLLVVALLYQRANSQKRKAA